MSEALEPSRKKVERAYKHIDDLNIMIGEFFRSDFYDLFVYKDFDERMNRLKYKLHRVLDVITAALIIGDVLHNLRSALDLLYYQIVLRCDGAPTKYTRFPILDTREELEVRLDAALKKQQITPTVRGFILKTIKPYKAGNFALWAIDDLNIRDKHQLLVPMLQLMAIEGIRLKDKEDGTEIPLSTIFIDDSWDQRLTELYGRDLEVTDKGHASAAILFHLGTPLEGQAALPALNGIAEEVTRTIEAFDTLLF